MSKSIIERAKLAALILQNPFGWKIIRKRLTYLSIGALINLRDKIKQIEDQSVPGIILETGCALGGSAIQMASAKSKERELRLYDVFGMIPPPTDADDQDISVRYEEIKAGNSKGIRGDEYYGYKENLKQTVSDNLAAFGFDPPSNNIKLVQGLYEEVLQIDEPVALAHIDCDWYSSVMTCLKQITPHLSIGGCLLIDDYYEWSGCKKAIDEFFDEERKAQFKFENQHDKLIIQRIK